MLDHPPAARDHGTPKRILAIDDVDFNTSILEIFLESKGYVVATAVSATQAMELLDKESFDLILLDIMMPEMDGFEFLRKLRKKYSITDLPIIMLTALNESKDLVRAMRLGANDYITKPIHTDVVEARVKNQLSIKDITRQLKDANHTIQVQTEQLQMVMDSATIAIFSLDLKGTIASANQTTADIRGLEVSELIGSPFISHIADSVRGETEAVLDKVIGQGYFVTNFETILMRPNGDERLINLGLRAIHQNGKIIAVTGTAEDITRVRRQREVLAAHVRTLENPDQDLLNLLEPSHGTFSLDAMARQNMEPEPEIQDENAPATEMNRRQHIRRKAYKGGKLSFNNDSSLMDCIIRDLSDGGAKLQFESHFDCPRYAVLRISDGAVYDCEVRRFANTVMGVRFLKKKKAA